MVIEVHLHTILQLPTSQGLIKQLEIELPPGSSLADLINRIGVKIDLDSTLLVVNSRIVENNHLLVDGDEVHLIPALSGGSRS